MLHTLLTQISIHMISRRYLAPELLNGKYTEVGLDKADLFALGATLYELATVSLRLLACFSQSVRPCLRVHKC